MYKGSSTRAYKVRLFTSRELGAWGIEAWLRHQGSKNYRESIWEVMAHFDITAIM
jgi:hypothetical protein